MRVIMIGAVDLTSAAGGGGISLYINEFIRSRPADIDVSLVGITVDPCEQLGQWSQRHAGHRRYDFMPACYVDSDVVGRHVPVNLRYSAGLLRYGGCRSWRRESVVNVHRFELALPFLLPSKRLPVVLTIHSMSGVIDAFRDSPCFKEHPLFRYAWYRGLHFSLEEYVLRRVDKVVVVSSAILEYYGAKFPDLKEKVVWVPTSVDLDRFRPMDRTAVRKKQGLAPESQVVAFVGRLAPEKNVSFLIDAFSRLKGVLPHAVFLIAGDGPERPRLKARAEHLRLSDVKFLGTIDHDSLPEILNCTDVFWLASSWEGTPLAMLEALACGVPTVAVGVDGVIGVLSGALDSLVVTERTPEALVHTTVRLLTGGFDARLSDICRRVAERYSAVALSQELSAAYCDAMYGSHARSPEAGQCLG